MEFEEAFQQILAFADKMGAKDLLMRKGLFEMVFIMGQRSGLNTADKIIREEFSRIGGARSELG